MTYEKSMEILKEYFTPGRIVNAYVGLDKVISFKAGKDLIGGWQVIVAECDKDGNIIGENRVHATTPKKSELQRVLGRSF